VGTDAHPYPYRRHRPAPCRSPATPSAWPTPTASGPSPYRRTWSGDRPWPPPADLLVTAYDLLHATGIDRGPYTALANAFRRRILGLEVADEPPLPTFADGMAAMAVLDAARRSAAGSGWEPVVTPQIPGKPVP